MIKRIVLATAISVVLSVGIAAVAHAKGGGGGGHGGGGHASGGHASSHSSGHASSGKSTSTAHAEPSRPTPMIISPGRGEQSEDERKKK